MNIPNKSFFKANEVCKISGVKPYVLRYWESEFPEIDPLTSASGQKLYEHKDIEMINKIKNLLLVEQMTIAQAKLQLRRKPEAQTEIPISEDLNELEEIEEIPQVQESQNLDSTEDEVNVYANFDLVRERLNGLVSFAEALKQQHNWQ